MVEFVRDFDMKLTVEESYELVAHIQAQPLTNCKIIEAHEGDELLKKMRERVRNDGKSEWRIGTNVGLWYRVRLYVPNLKGLREEVLNVAHNSKLAMHPGSTKIYQDLKQNYWWDNMRKEIAETRKGHDLIWVIVDRLTKSTHFLPIKTSSSAEDLAKLYIKKIVRLHGIPLEIVSDQDTRFTSIFWTYIQEAMGESWDDCLPYAEFAYNNSFQAGIGMAPYEALKKSYVDTRRRDLEFEVGDYVFLKISPMKSVSRFGKKGKLAPRFIGPFQILDRVGAVTYRLALPTPLAWSA
ncbi:uncharacterized protein LOC131224880 [Magnolia sinica]|uniref:uncharacterized protein LOC131224880 n=1 Tax=Magnolia sinica TaxID=86752 RepID=UPI00265B14CB|nr:uncharacterized protein LOC131224880 [Magnolia sinica]